jgi:hypothetical protein
MNKTQKTLATVIILAIVLAAVGFVINLGDVKTQLSSVSSQNPTPTPAINPQTNNVTVSGYIIVHGLPIPPTEVAFISETQQVYKAPINAVNNSYIISLPSNQTYGIEGDWNGRTFNATGIPMGAITMRCDNGAWVLNLYNATNSITQNLQVGMTPGEPTLTPPEP